MRCLTVLTYFIFLCLSTNAQTEENRLTDSLYHQLSVTDIPQEKAHIHNELAYHFHTLDSAKATYHAQNALKIATTNHLILEKGKAYKHLALVQGYLDYKESAIAFNDSAYQYFTLMKDTQQMISIHNNVGRILCDVGRFQEAIKGYQLSESWLQEDKKRWLILRYNYIACLSDMNQQYQLIIDLCKEAIEVSEKEKNTYFELLFNNLLGNTLVETKSFSEALECFAIALKLLEALRSPEGVSYDSGLESDLYNNRAIVYKEIGAYEQAYQDLQKALFINQTLYESDLPNAEIYINLGTICVKLRRSKEGILYFQKGITGLEKANKLSFLDYAYEEYATALEDVGNYKEALSLQKKSQVFKDSIYSIETRKITEELNAKYENEKIKKDLSTTRLAFIEQQYKTRLFIGLGIITALILGCLLWLRNLKQQQYQIENEKKQAELKYSLLRTQMNPHFIFNALNSVQGFFMSNQMINGNEFMGMFTELIRKVLDQSALSKHPIVDELASLELYLGLENVRLEGNLQYNIQYPPNLDIEYIKIPPLIFQPFVENAIWHGIVPKKEKGFIDIQLNLSADEHFLLATIKDDGVGLQNTKKQHHSKGINITKERLGASGDVRIANDVKGKGVVVHLKIPITES